MATERQIALFEKFLDTRIELNKKLLEVSPDGKTYNFAAIRERRLAAFSIMEVRDASDTLRTTDEGNKSLEAAYKALTMTAAHTATVPTATVVGKLKEEGMFKVGERIFKVVRAIYGSDELYAKELIETAPGKWSFVFAKGAIKSITEADRMSIEEAKKFGQLTGTCCVCGRVLTNEASIEAGIGPICATKF